MLLDPQLLIAAAMLGISTSSLVHATLAGLGISLAVASGRTAQLFARSPHVRAWLDGIAGTIYIALALRMFLIERRPA